jgi:hypothetical protein
MKIYETLNVTVKLQTNGSAWLVVLEGPTEEIELTFNGLSNLGGVGGRTRLEYADGDKTLASCWTTEEQMYHFWYMRAVLKSQSDNDCLFHAYAKRKMAQLRRNLIVHAKIGNFQATWDNDHDACCMGLTVAEKPDNDFRDAVLEHSFKCRESVKQVEKALGHA